MPHKDPVAARAYFAARYQRERASRAIISEQLCACGCGQPTLVAPQTVAKNRVEAGQPLRFRKGHNLRREPTDLSVDATMLWSRVRKTDGCWLWTGGLNHAGYGFFKVGGRRGRTTLAHRATYALMVGPIPQGLELDHLCRVRNCVRPDHLEPVTHAENVRRAFA